MQKEIRVVDKEKKIVRITTLGERWYAKPSTDKETGLPIFEFWPSSTWIASYWPKGIGFMKWYASKGYDEAEAIKLAAGDKGTKVHYACGDIDEGVKINIGMLYKNPTTGVMEELLKEEIDCIKSYIDFIDEKKPTIFANELTVFGDVYAGTIDKIFAMGQIKEKVRQIWILDLKTGKTIYRDSELQISSYSHAKIDYKKYGITDEEWENRKLATLQLGYDKYRIPGKPHYKFTEIKDKYDLFRNVTYPIWQDANPNAKPKEIEYPLILSSKFRAEQVEKGKELATKKKGK